MKKKTYAFTIVVLAAALALADGSSRPSPASPQAAPGISYAPSGWTTPVNISNSDAESRNPVVAVDDNGKAYVTWIDWPFNVGAGGPRFMMFNSNRTGSWTPSLMTIADIQYTAIDDVGFPTVAVNRTGTNFVVGFHDADYSRGLMQSWYREFSNGAWGPLASFSDASASCSYIMMAYSPVDNSLFGIFMADDNDVFNFAMRYRDGISGQYSGSQWINVLMGSSKYNYLTKTIAIDPSGTAHIVFTTHSEGWYFKNPNPKNFDGWTSTKNFTGATGMNDTDPRIVCDNDGDVYTVWQQNIGGSPDIMLRKTVNGVWQTAENISNTSDYSDGATVAVNPATKEIYVAWQEGSGAAAKVMMKSYEFQAGGATKAWSSAVTMSSEFGPSGEPFLAWDATGGLHLVYAASIGGNRLDIVYMVKPGVNVTITSPNGGESWEALKTFPITWTTVGTVANVKIEYSTDGGVNYSTIVASTPNTGTYNWTVPNNPSTNCLMRISETSTGKPTDTSDAVFTITRPSVMPPLNPTLATALNSTRDKKTNSLSWAANPLNVNVTVASYKIYRKLAAAADSTFAVLGSVSGSTIQYDDANLDILTKFAYRLTAVTNLSAESLPSTTVVETQKFEFAPVGVALTTIINKVLFNQIKENTILFSDSPYNPSADVAGFDVYRRKTTESDSSLALITSLGASTFSYKDAGLKGGGKYAYAVKTRYTDGRVSSFSTVVSEK